MNAPHCVERTNQRGSDALLERRQERDGYVLLLVLVMIMVSGIVLVSVARHSFRLAVESRDRENELQARWGAISLQSMLLPRAATMFDRIEESKRKSGDTAKPIKPIHSSIIMGRHRFDFRLADESAKANVNTLYHYGGRQSVETSLRQLVPGSSLIRPRLEPETIPKGRFVSDLDAEDEPPELAPAFRSWGQVFDLADSRQAVSGRRRLPQLTQSITCWGSGRMNIGRAADAAIIEVCALAIPKGRARQVVKKLRETPGLRLANLFEEAGIGERDQHKLEHLIVQQSGTFSVWVTVSGPDGVYERFAVSQVNEKGITRVRQFAF